MKSRLTITLDENVLKRIDSLVDKKTIRNRSHAIEKILLENLSPHIDTAVVLAGGGLKNTTHPLLKKIKNRHLYAITLSHMAKFGIHKVVMCAGKHTKALQDKIGSHFAGLKIMYLPEERKLGTSGIVAKAKKFIKDDFLVIHADILTNINLEGLFDFHFEEEGVVATIAVKPRNAEKNYGKVIMQGNKIAEFLGIKGERGLSIVNTGIYVFSTDIFKLIPKNRPSTFEEDIFPRLAKKEQLGAYLFQGSWFNITHDYKQANLKWKN